MDVFVGFTDDTSVKELSDTLEAWLKISDAAPAAVKCPVKRYELYRRVAAENLSEGDYILCDVGCVPVEENFIVEVRNAMVDKVGLLGSVPFGQTLSPEMIPTGIRACRKGIVSQWPAKSTQTYDEEHVTAYKLRDYTSTVCPSLHHHRLGMC